MLKPGDIAIVSGARTPFGRYCGKLKDFTAQELGAIAGKCAIERAGLDPGQFDHAVFGNAQQTSGDALYGARHVALRAGLDRKSTRLNSSHTVISYAVFCLKKKKNTVKHTDY